MKYKLKRLVADAMVSLLSLGESVADGLLVGVVCDPGCVPGPVESELTKGPTGKGLPLINCESSSN